MRFISLIYYSCLGLGWLANAAVTHSPSTNATEAGARDAATGYRSVAYFVNWVGTNPS